MEQLEYEIQVRLAALCLERAELSPTEQWRAYWRAEAERYVEKAQWA